MHKHVNGKRRCQTIPNSQKALKTAKNTTLIIYKSKEKYNSQKLYQEFLLPV